MFNTAQVFLPNLFGKFYQFVKIIPDNSRKYIMMLKPTYPKYTLVPNLSSDESKFKASRGRRRKEVGK